MGDAVDVVRRLEGAWAAFDHDAARTLVASDFGEHAQHLGSENFDSAVMANEGLRSAFSDLSRTIEDIFAEDDMVVVRVRMQGTNSGGLPWLGIPANDKKVDVEWISIYRVADGKVAEHWAQMDLPTMMTQLGAMPGM